MAITINSSYDDIYKELYEQRKQALNEALEKTSEKYALQKASVTDAYNAQISDAQELYEDTYRQNAVQKLINEKKISENMANTGLTDSGLNRTQMTAVQLSYSNQKAETDRQRQKAVDALNLAMTEKLTALDVNRIGEEESLKSNYDSDIKSEAQNIYNTNLSELTTRYKTQLSAATTAAKSSEAYTSAKSNGIIFSNGANLSRDYNGTLVQNGVVTNYNNDGSVTYYDKNTGNSSTFAAGVNPYTNTTNADVKYGTFSNGYQPDNIGGIKLEAVPNFNATVRGRPQKVFSYVNRKTEKVRYYVVWLGDLNAYAEYDPIAQKFTGEVFS